MKPDPESTSGENRCTVCGSMGSKPLLSKAQDGRGPGPIFLHKCDVCEVVFLGWWSEGYDSHLYDYYSDRMSADKTDIYNSITEIRYEGMLAYLLKISPGNRVLDVGCGQGHFVDVALRAGWDVLGIELSESAVAICQNFGLPVEKMDLFSPNLEEGGFDLLTMFEVIEHVPNPSEFVRRAEQLLRPAGLLYLTTPNFDSFDRRLLGASWHAIHREHLTYFTPQTMRHLISANTSLEIEYFRTRNLSASTLRSLLWGRPTEAGRVEPSSEESTCMGDVDREEALRRRIESSRALRALKSVVNKALDSFGLGADMVVICRRPT